ncbi:tetratricopeptide repeat protein [Sneathiella aquimaris]|uniref:tetratricopeptide repeat protein n=1 Tax=Sneathiella aquimaris TaxID=2599305 RepID=UPI00146D48FB|nr:tetratricopeptide repeat protein [Sneathiella aquimaris]
MLAVGLLLTGSLLSDFAIAQQSTNQSAPPKRDEFAIPVIAKQLQAVIAALTNKRFENAEAGLNNLTEKYPWHMESHYLKASLLAIQGRLDEAFTALDTAVLMGFDNKQALYKDPNLTNLRKDDRFQKIVEKLLAQTSVQRPAVKASKIENGLAKVTSENTRWERRIGMLRSSFQFNSRKVAPATVQNNKSDVAAQLNQLFRSGRGAGNAGDIYDNRDRRHSYLNAKEFPQLALTAYDQAAQQNNIDFGLNASILFNAPTFGNSSTALNSGPYWRSLARLAYTTGGDPARLFLQYINNHLYVYPAVGDFKKKNGDLYPANSPYLIISKGKSGSDQPHLRAIAAILAALKPDVKDALIKDRRLMPTVQMVFRQGLKTVQSEADYLSHRAHPVVFDGDLLDPLKMVQLANDLTYDDIPPLVVLSVKEETEPRKGWDEFMRQLPEKLFDTPASISRIVRTTAFEKKITVDAASTRVPEGQSVSYKWVILQGDPDKIKITPTNSSASQAEITVKWHEPFRSPIQSDLRSSRVEIGVFANNGTHMSAPSFINLFYPVIQKRHYDPNGKLLAIDHRNDQKTYLDPRIFPKRDWRDDYHYDDQGRLTGWTRRRKSGTSEFSRHGALIAEKDNLGRPISAWAVGYLYERDNRGRMISKEKQLNAKIKYQYLNDKDKLGIIIQ